MSAALRYSIVALLWLVSACAYAQEKRLQSNETLCGQFYTSVGSDIFWFGEGAQLRAEVKQIADSLPYWGIKQDKFVFPEYARDSLLSHELLAKQDRKFTNIFIEMMRGVYEGSGIDDLIKNDEVSGKFDRRTDSVLKLFLDKLARKPYIRELLSALEPDDTNYTILKAELGRLLAEGNAEKSRAVAASLNLYKWMYHFNFEKYVVVNIPAARLTAFKNKRSEISMKVVVGKPSTRTPRFSSWCDKVILYPYWNVPADIARKELVPMFKRNLAEIDKLNIWILGKDGKRIDPHNLDWSTFNRSYFPYAMRQCTGCDNSLGVIKFNLTDPFSVYLHDTNYKLAFSKESRYLSHGCIRVAEPIELGNFILENKLDSNFLKACYRDQEPVLINVSPKIPVFVVYMTAVPENGSVVYYKDVYHLFK